MVIKSWIDGMAWDRWVKWEQYALNAYEVVLLLVWIGGQISAEGNDFFEADAENGFFRCAYRQMSK